MRRELLDLESLAAHTEGLPRATWRFDEFEFHDRPFALSKNGEPVKLVPQAARLLELLLRHSGHTVDRGAIRDTLWSEDVHVNFEQGINFVVRELRKALADSPRRPRFIETIPQVGYRFVADVSVERADSEPSRRPRPRRSHIAAAFVLVGLLGTTTLLGRLGLFGPLRSAEPTSGAFPADLSAPVWIDGAGETWRRGIFLSTSDHQESRIKGLAFLHEAVQLGEAPDAWPALLTVKEAQIGSIESALEMARGLLADDPESPEAHYVFGIVALFRDYDWAAAAAHLQRAVRSESVGQRSQMVYAKYLSAIGRHGEATTLVNAVLVEDPLSAEVRRLSAQLSFNAELFDDAIALAEPLVELRDRDGGAHWILIRSHYLAGREEEARLSADAYLGAWGWDPGTAESLATFWEITSRHGVNDRPNHVAFLRHNLGDTAGAIAALVDAACTEKRSWDPDLLFVGVDPGLAGLRQEPEFSQVMRCLNLNPLDPV